MKKKLLSVLFLFAMLVGIIAFALPASAYTDGNTIIEKNNTPLKIWFDEAAPLLPSEHKPTAPNGGSDVDEAWEKWSLPIGNGYFGANVFGRTETERIQISEKTLVNPHSLKNGGTTYTVGGTNSFSETFIDFGHTSSAVTNYNRYLDLTTAISGVQYQYNGVTYTREYFTSYPDKAIVIRLDADTNGALSFTLRPTIPYEQSYAAFKGDGVTKSGTVTSSVTDGVGKIELSGNMGYYGIDFLGIYKVYTDGGTIAASTTQHSYKDTDGTSKTDTDGTIVVEGAKSAYIVLSLGTDYELSSDIFTSAETNKPTKNTTIDDTRVKVEGYMSSINSKISGKSFEQAYNTLKNSHISDYKNLFDRVSINLGAKESDLALTTDKLLERYKNGTESTYLEMLLFQYGRYLLISSSRDGSLPANLQGVWNTYNMPAWACDYTHNINVEMNYWPAFSTNLAETFRAYVDYNSAYMKQAELYADAIINKINPDAYDKDGGNGWVLGDHTTVYKYTSHESAGNLGFMTQVFWEWYAYTKDPVVLEYVYNVLVNAARYITKCVKLDENGNYLIENSDSPEMFVNGIWYYTDGTTYAQSFAYLNNYNALEAAKSLGIDLNDSGLLSTEEYSILNTIMEQIDKYDPINVGLSGQIKEFREEDHYCSPGDEYHHRHTSQLVGLYPGNLINSTTPAWLDAAVVTLTERGDLGSGWGVAFKMNHWARTKNGERAHDLLESLFKNYMYENLWAQHPPFQIDANFGATAGISEMLLQSHEGYIAPLAALPSAWSTGSYTGLVARGNFEVSAAWENGLAKTFNITSKSGGTASVYYPSITGAYVVDSDGNTVNYTVSGQDLISFETEVGKTYIIYGFKEVKTPDAPKNLDFVKSADGTYNLTWSSVSGAKSYNVYVAIENDATYTLLGTVNGTSFTYVPAAENKNARMTFAVTAVSEGESKRALTYNNDDLKTEYGIVPKESLVKPYALFVKKATDTEYTFVKGFDKFINAANEANSLLLVSNGAYRGGTAVIYMLRDSQASGDSYNNACQIDGTIIFDLGGNRLRSGVNRLIGFEAKQVSGNLSSFSRVEIKNGTILTISKPIAEIYCGGTTGSFAFTGTKKCEILFDNITFSNGIQKTLTDPVSILKSRGTFTETKQAELKAEFKNCTFDYSDNSKSFTIIDCSAGGQYAKCDVTIAGGKISTSTNVKIFSGSVNDKLTYTIGTDGKETEFETTGGGMVTKYGIIPASDLTSDKKFAAFGKKNNEQSYTYIATYGGIHSGALNNARDKIKHDSGAYAGGEVVILMLCDYEYTSNDGGTSSAWNRGMMVDGTMIFDLGGHSLTISKARFIGFETGSSDVVGNVADYNTTFKIVNGTIISNNPIAEVFSGSSAYTGNKRCRIDLENLTFKSKGSASITLFKARGDFKDGQSVDFAINLNNCIFDYPSTTTVKVFEETSTLGEVKSTVTISGGSFNVTNNALTVFSSSDAIDTITFAKDVNGNYTTAVMPKGSSAPAESFNGGSLVFVKLYENSTTVTYKLIEKEFADFKFLPKMSITLDEKLVINVYVPADLLVGFSFNGNTYKNLAEIEELKKEIDGKYYYVISTPIDAANGIDEYTLTAALQNGSVSATAKFTFSIPKYATKVIDNGSDIEKQLIKDILSYIRAAYAYFYPANTEAIAVIDAIIGKDYDATSPVNPEGSAENPEGFESVTFALTSTPAIKFYLQDGFDAAKYSFEINGKKTSFTTGADASGSYVKLDVYAYAMCETVECFFDGNSIGSYHIASYYEWAKTQNDPTLTTLVERFWKYCQSARDYRNQTQIMINYIDEYGNELTGSDSVTVTAGESKKLLSPAIAGYYTRDLYVTVSSESAKSIDVVYKKIPTNLDTDKIKNELLPNIVAWGDSITIGIGRDELTMANTYGIDLVSLGAATTGSNYTEVLKNLITTYVYSGLANIENFGVGGEATSTIAARADTETYYLYLDGAVSIGSSKVTVPLTHYASVGRVGILRQGGSYIVNDVIIEGKDISGNDISVKGKLECALKADAPSGTNKNTCDAKYLEYTFTRTDGGTNTLNFVSGARVRTRCSYEFDGRTCIIFMGENGGYSDVNELIKQQEEILLACGNPEMYLIISTTSGSYESRTEIRNALSARWGERYINMGDEINSRKAYELAGYSDSVIATVEGNIANGTVSSLLIKDNCHPNAVGYAVIGNIIFEKLFDIGAFDALFDYYDSIETFEFNGYTATVIRPENPNGKWIWKTEFFYAFDAAEEALSEEGYTRVYYSISNKYGNPESVSLMESFYHEVTKRYDLDEKCILFGFSRGGLYAFNFALECPEYVDKMYLDAPVLDLKTWPTATKNPTEYNGMLNSYGLTEAEFETFTGSPIDKLEEFFKLNIPLLVVAGDADATVPFDANAGRLIEYANANGYSVTYVVEEGKDHHPHSLTDVSIIVEFCNG